MHLIVAVGNEFALDVTKMHQNQNVDIYRLSIMMQKRDVFDVILWLKQIFTKFYRKKNILIKT